MFQNWILAKLVDAILIGYFQEAYEAQYGELLRQDLRSRNQPDALHLTSSAAADTESSSGFQVLDADMVNLARKNFMLMNAVLAGVYEFGFGTNPVF